MAVFTFPYLALLITTLSVAVGLTFLVILTKALRETKSNVDLTYETTK